MSDSHDHLQRVYSQVMHRGGVKGEPANVNQVTTKLKVRKEEWRRAQSLAGSLFGAHCTLFFEDSELTPQEFWAQVTSNVDLAAEYLRDIIELVPKLIELRDSAPRAVAERCRQLGESNNHVERSGDLG